LTTQPVKLLYIAGVPRTGTTLISNVLGQVEGFFAAGELTGIWAKPFSERKCACGTPFLQCPVWQPAIDYAYNSPGNVPDGKQMMEWESRARLRDLPKILKPGGIEWLQSQTGEYVPHLAKLYAGAKEATGCRVVVDTSKQFLHSFLFIHAPGIELYTVHIIRDPRACAEKAIKRGARFFKEGILDWIVFHRLHEKFGMLFPNRYIQLRYEDFTREPRTTIEQIVDFAGEKASTWPFVDECRVEIKGSHIAAGNPNRSQFGIVEIKEDQDWKTRLSYPQRLLVNLLTRPWMRKYGY
jgi:hypothetical protein